MKEPLLVNSLKLEKSLPDAGAAALVHVVPLLVSRLPVVPGATACTANVPLPSSTLFAVSVAAPVPPLATGSVPVTPVVRESPVAFVSVNADGVPRLGVVSTGLVDSTTLPVPVDAVTPVPPLLTGSVPVTPVVSGSPVALVKVTADGVPRLGVVSTGLVDSTTLPVPVDTVTPVPPLPTGKVPVAEARLIGGRMDESVVMLLPYHTAGGASITGGTSTGGTGDSSGATSITGGT